MCLFLGLFPAKVASVYKGAGRTLGSPAIADSHTAAAAMAAAAAVSLSIGCVGKL